MQIIFPLSLTTEILSGSVSAQGTSFVRENEKIKIEIDFKKDYKAALITLVIKRVLKQDVTS